MAKKDFLARQAATQRAYFDAGLQCGRQQILDMMTLVLRDPSIMGKDIFGRARIEKLFAKCQEYDSYYDLCFTKHVDADKRQEEMDRVLKEIWGNDLCPFAERYPYTKYYGYNKPLKEWVE